VDKGELSPEKAATMKSSKQMEALQQQHKQKMSKKSPEMSM
jgi:hypothetical protein